MKKQNYFLQPNKDINVLFYGKLKKNINYYLYEWDTDGSNLLNPVLSFVLTNEGKRLDVLDIYFQNSEDFILFNKS